MADGVIEEVLRLDPGQAKTALGDVAQEAMKTSAAMGSLTRSSGASSVSLGQLAYQLNDVATMAAMGAAPLQILASQGGQIAQIFTHAGGSASGFAAAAAVVAVQAGLAYLALHDWNAEAEALHDATVAATKVHADFASILEDTAAAEVALKVATGELTKEQGLLETQALKTFKALREAVHASNTDMATLTTAQGSLTTQTVDFFEAWVPAWAPLKSAFSALTTSSADYQLQIEAGREAQQANIASTKELRQIQAETTSETEKAKRAKEAETAARKAATAAIKAEREALAELKREFAMEATAAAGVGGVFGSDPVSETRAKFEAQTTALMDAVRIYRTLGQLGEHLNEIEAAKLALAQSYTEEMNAAYAAMQAQAEGSTTAGDNYNPSAGASGYRTADTINTAGRGVQGGLQMISAMGPVGAIVAAVLQIIKGIQEGLLDGVHQWVMEFLTGLDNLPAVLGDALIRSIEEGLPALFDAIPGLIKGVMLDLVPAIVESVVVLIRTLIQELIDLVTPGNKKERADYIARTGDRGGKGSTSSGTMSWSEVGAFFTGQTFSDGSEYVSRSGLAMVHAGEEIRQAGGAWSTQAMYGTGSTTSSDPAGRARMSSRGGKLTFELDAAEVAREFARARSTQGLGF